MHNLHKHFHFNAWANGRVSEMIMPVDEDLLHKEIKSSFPNVAKTLLHVWDAETIWMKRIQGESITAFPSKEFTGNKDDILKGLTQTSERFSDFINSKDDSFFKSSISYKNMKGDSFEDTVEGLLYHVVNHSSYHRGQIVTMLRELGITDILSTDLIFYLRLK